MTRRAALFVAIGLVAPLCSTSTTKAGYIFVFGDPGTTPVAAALYRGSGIELLRSTTLQPVPLLPFLGVGVIGPFPDQDQIFRSTLVKRIGGRVSVAILKLTPPLTIASAEPFDIPSFTSDTGEPLVAEFDLNGFLATPNPFTPGQQYAVADGQIDSVPSIIFRDGSGLPTDPAEAASALNDPTVVAALPLFTGNVTAQLSDRFAVPEPSSVVQLGTAAVALAGVFGWRRRRTAA